MLYRWTTGQTDLQGNSYSILKMIDVKALMEFRRASAPWGTDAQKRLVLVKPIWSKGVGLQFHKAWGGQVGLGKGLGGSVGAQAEIGSGRVTVA
jgi:hypothetical protein